MGKHRHSKDKQFIIQREYKVHWGEADEKMKNQYAKLPFYCCALGLQPFKNPVCTSDGIIYDLINIIPFIKKFKQCPVTGKPLKIGDLIKLNFHKNKDGDYHDPISFKQFTDHTNIVAIKTSGNVFSLDTIEELNKKPKFWKDLVSSDNFTHKDIIVLQDPEKTRQIKDFDHVNKNIVFDAVEKPTKPEDFINQSSQTKKIMGQVQEQIQKQEQIKKEKELQAQKELQELIEKQQQTSNTSVQEFIDFALKTKLFRHQRETSIYNAISVTTTQSNATTGKTEFRTLDESEIRKKIYDEVKGRAQKGHATIKTNLGDLNFKIHTDLTPIAGENFLELAENKFYQNMKFHRLIHDFMIQGGDPTGTGKGGKSIFGGSFQDEFHPKLTHTEPGMLAMANSGPDSNNSQFYITLSDCNHLDSKHTVFGEIMAGMPTLFKINKVPTTKDKPDEDIIIEDIIVHNNPYRDAIQKIKDNIKKEEQIKEQQKKYGNNKRESNDRWIKDIQGFEPNKKVDTGIDNQKEKNKEKPIQKAGILGSILSVPTQVQKQKTTQFNFSNW